MVRKEIDLGGFPSKMTDSIVVFHFARRYVMKNLYELRMFGAFFQQWSSVFADPFNVMSSINPLAHVHKELGNAFYTDAPKPEFLITEILVGEKKIPITEEVVAELPFCRLLHFMQARKGLPKVLLVAPLSGHYATLLRETARKFLEDHDVYITDWANARDVPLAVGDFGMEHYVDYLRNFFALLNKGAKGFHVVAVCQPGVPTLVATALESACDGNIPTSLTLLAAPIDTRINPTEVNKFAGQYSLDWFKEHMIHEVPGKYLGYGRKVHAGFLQLALFMAPNMRRHFEEHHQKFTAKWNGDRRKIERHDDFYKEYNAVMDLSGDYYLETVDWVFHRHLLPLGKWMHGDEPVHLHTLRRTRLLTIEGEDDDIVGRGQTHAALELTPNIPESAKEHFLALSAGHFGVFGGKVFRGPVYEKIREFIKKS